MLDLLQLWEKWAGLVPDSALGSCGGDAPGRTTVPPARSCARALCRLIPPLPPRREGEPGATEQAPQHDLHAHQASKALSRG